MNKPLTEEQEKMWERLKEDPMIYKVNRIQDYGVFYCPYVPIIKNPPEVLKDLKDVS